MTDICFRTVRASFSRRTFPPGVRFRSSPGGAEPVSLFPPWRRRRSAGAAGTVRPGATRFLRAAVPDGAQDSVSALSSASAAHRRDGAAVFYPGIPSRRYLYFCCRFYRSFLSPKTPELFRYILSKNSVRVTIFGLKNTPFCLNFTICTKFDALFVQENGEQRYKKFEKVWNL